MAETTEVLGRAFPRISEFIPVIGTATPGKLITRCPLWVNLRHFAMLPRKSALGVRADGIGAKADIVHRMSAVRGTTDVTATWPEQPLLAMCGGLVGPEHSCGFVRHLIVRLEGDAAGMIDEPWLRTVHDTMARAETCILATDARKRCIPCSLSN